MSTLLFIAVGVSMDAAAVAAAYAIRGAGLADLLKLAGTFGVFQFAMALAGALGGAPVTRYFATVDHWIVFALLAFVGAKMIWDAARDNPERGPVTVSGAQLMVLGIATSIDALAVGVTLPALRLGSWTASSTIGVFTFAFSLGGAYAGTRMGERFGSAVEVVGGVLLIFIGGKTVVEHLLASPSW